MCNCRITATYFLIVLVHNIKFKGTGGGNYWKVVILTKRLIAQIYIHQAVYAWALEEIEWQSCFPQHKIKIDLLLFYDFCEVFFFIFFSWIRLVQIRPLLFWGENWLIVGRASKIVYFRWLVSIHNWRTYEEWLNLMECADFFQMSVFGGVVADCICFVLEGDRVYMLRQ